MSTCTLDSIISVLNDVTSEEKYPKEDRLKDFPFGKQLIELAYDPKYSRANEHVKKVVVQANKIVQGHPSDLIIPPRLQETARRIDDLFLKLALWADRQHIKRDALIQIGSLYHDIGKWIVHERHPIEGFYLLQYLFPIERDCLISLLGGRDTYDLLIAVIRDHDKFGIISTGEGSLSVITDLLNPAKTDVEFYRAAIVTLLMINMADIAVSAPDGLRDPQATWLVDDAELILNRLENAQGSRLSLVRSLTAADQESARTILRISRLVDSAYKNAILVQKRRYEKWNQANNGQKPPQDYTFRQDNWPQIPFSTILDAVNDELQVEFLGAAHQKFCRDFSHFSKLDYALYFFGEIARQCNMVRLNEKRQEYPLENLVEPMIEVLKSVVNTYQELTVEDELSPRRIGIQMEGLLRTDRIKETVSALLTGNVPQARRTRADVISWITNEVSVWLFV